MSQIAIIKIKGCKEQAINGGIGGCPYKRSYGVESGCVFKYGTLPEKGFPDWCPLEKVKHPAKKRREEMKIIKIGTFDKRGMPIGWHLGCNDIPDEQSAVMNLLLDGRILVDRVEIVEWSNTKREERIKALNG